MEAATIETKASNDQAWNAVNHSFIYREESSSSRQDSFNVVHPLFAYFQKWLFFVKSLKDGRFFFL